MAIGDYLLVALLVIAAGYVIRRVQIAARDARRFRGKMLATCPETQATVAVKVATWREALAALVGRRHLELKSCTRWPERQDCGQECLSQFESDPEKHRVWKIASQWYEGKNCAYCGKPIEAFSHVDHRPALLSAEKRTAEWDQVPAEKLPEIMASSLPVCWNCHVVETFRREHPELVIERRREHVKA